MGYFSQLIAQVRDPHAGVHLRPLQPFEHTSEPVTRGASGFEEEVAVPPSQGARATGVRRAAPPSATDATTPDTGQTAAARRAEGAARGAPAAQRRPSVPLPEDAAQPLPPVTPRPAVRQPAGDPDDRQQPQTSDSAQRAAAPVAPAPRASDDASAERARVGSPLVRRGAGFAGERADGAPLRAGVEARSPQEPWAPAPPGMVPPPGKTVSPAADYAPPSAGPALPEAGRGALPPVSREARRRAPEPSGPPTIEIHIGRIDVRAAPQRPVGRPAQETAPVVPLDAFLKNGGRA